MGTSSSEPGPATPAAPPLGDGLPCPGCGALFAAHDGPTHRYIGASAGCWALYTPMTSGQAPDPLILDRSWIVDTPFPPSRWSTTGQVEPLLVDAYATQHHGEPSPQAIQSVAIHLLALHGVLDRGAPPERALWIRRRAMRQRGVYRWLVPPPLGKALTLRHLFPGGGVEHPRSVADYVGSVYAAWRAVHRATIDDLYDRFVLAE